MIPQNKFPELFATGFLIDPGPTIDTQLLPALTAVHGSNLLLTAIRQSTTAAAQICY